MSNKEAVDRMSGRDDGPIWETWVILCLGTFFIFIHLYSGIYGSPDSLLYRSLHVNTALALVFLTRPLGKGIFKALDLVMIAGAIWVQTYFFIELEVQGFS